MLAALLHFLLLAVSAMLQDDQYFASQFSTKIKHNENCELCYGIDCLSLDETRCQYYRKTENILNRTENFYIDYIDNKDNIDGYLLDYVQEGSQIYNYDCIPLISQYTNCYRENICTGCQTCNCDGMGRWNCTILERCDTTKDFFRGRPQSLATVMENLKEYINMFQGKKIKRSVIYDNEIEKEQIKYDDILKLLDEIDHFENKNKINTTKEIFVTQINTSKRLGNIDSYAWDTESLRFEELLNSFDFENITAQAKITISQNKSDNVNLNNTDSEHLNSKRKENNNILYVKSVELPTFDYLNTFDDNKTRSLKKREIEFKISPSQSNTSDNPSTNIRDLKNNVLYPLFNIVTEKQKELEQLLNVEEKLVIYFKSLSDINITSKVAHSSEVNDDLYLYFYQLQIPNELKDDTRRSNRLPNVKGTKEKYFKKLKRDLFEVTRDIANIQMLSNFSAMPHDLKVLIKAIKNYVNKEKRNDKIIEKRLPTTYNFRRQYNPISKLIHPLHIISNIFESFVKNVPVANTLKSFSPKAKQILERIVNRFHTDDFDGVSSKIFDHQYDIEKVLADIGNGWDRVITSITNNPLSDRLYSMKLLHLEVSANIEKIKIALEYLQYAENHRILVNKEGVGEKIIFRIETDFNRINQQVKRITQLQVLNRHLHDINTSAIFNNNSQPTINSTKNNKRKTKTFLQTIKKLLKKSKKDIRDLFRKKLHKSDIMKNSVDEMTKNKLTEYEKTMQRWQNNLNVRNKRSAIETESFFSRLKNIIPQYLRGKVNPVVHKKRGNNTISVKKKRLHRGHKGNKKIKIKSTTPGI